jgi:hypothetical protein
MASQGRMRRDTRKGARPKHQGVRVRRLPAKYVLENPDGAAAVIAQAARNPSSIGEGVSPLHYFSAVRLPQSPA